MALAVHTTGGEALTVVVYIPTYMYMYIHMYIVGKQNHEH
jgi:hypothetical protein